MSPHGIVREHHNVTTAHRHIDHRRSICQFRTSGKHPADQQILFVRRKPQHHTRSLFGRGQVWTKRAALLFDSSQDMSASTIGLVWFLTRTYSGRYYNEPLQLTDAVAVSGLRAMGEAQRRAVVLVVGKRGDHSLNDSRAVRHYLADIGVPLFVWSVTGPRPELTDIWGEVEDVSSMNGLRAAADKLRENLAAQRIAWVDVDPLKALRLRADSRCGMATVARHGT